jgi:benzoyl-CoA-dihydrodiol lyase
VDHSTELAVPPAVDFQTDPARYKHWRLSIDGRVATLTLDVDEGGGIRPGYKLKLNSYDLGVDIELHDALQRIRFEHPTVAAVVLTSAKSRMFSSGANIYMLGQSAHAWKVNFCKFTNETRNGMEDSSAWSGLKFLAACNGVTAGGGYELALACDEIILVDDRSSAVSLPEVSLLAVLPGTGGLTRLIDKRRVRRDHADVFCTTPEGVRGQRAKDWRLVDDVVRTQDFSEHVRRRADALAQDSTRPTSARGIVLTPLQRIIDAQGLHYEYVDVQFDRARRLVTMTVHGPAATPPLSVDDVLGQGAAWWPLQMARELDDAILHLRTNELELGLWLLETAGDPAAVLACDAFLSSNRDHWFVRETLGMLRRTLQRLDVSSRSMFALVRPESCFCGTLAELLWTADRAYMLQGDGDGPQGAISVSAINFGALPMATGNARLANRLQDEGRVGAAASRQGARFSASEALRLGLVTETPDSLDWDDEIRQAIETRIALSPDALTGMEANLRFALPETPHSRVFGRLSAWQNWIFTRPNAVGQQGALTVYGSGAAARFGWERV